VTRISPDAAPFQLPILISASSTSSNELPTHRIVEISSHIIELAMLANKCTAPPTIQTTYAIENNMVQIALNKKRIRLYIPHKMLWASDLINLSSRYLNIQRMIAAVRPGMILISGFNQECSESQLSHSAGGHEGEEEWVIMSLDIRHGVQHRK
jgi:hypothetical protein